MQIKQLSNNLFFLFILIFPFFSHFYVPDGTIYLVFGIPAIIAAHISWWILLPSFGTKETISLSTQKKILFSLLWVLSLTFLGVFSVGIAIESNLIQLLDSPVFIVLLILVLIALTVFHLALFSNRVATQEPITTPSTRQIFVGSVCDLYFKLAAFALVWYRIDSSFGQSTSEVSTQPFFLIVIPITLFFLAYYLPLKFIDEAQFLFEENKKAARIQHAAMHMVFIAVLYGQWVL